jgi:hypothetical protein
LGALVTLWSLADSHADEDGTIAGYDFQDIDDLVGVPGFCESLPDDWICQTDGWVNLPNYQEHNGRNAKKRAQTAKRVANAKANAKGNDEVTQAALPDALPREEKRREEKRREWERPESVDKQAWQEFEQHRAEIKKPLTNQSRTKNANVLAEHPPAVQQEIVNTTIANRWTGLFPPKNKPSADNGSTETSRPSLRTL